MAPLDGRRNYTRTLEQAGPAAIDKPQKPILSPFAQAAQQAREDVLRALRECGTTNTDFLPERRCIGTHKLRPLAHLGESIIPEEPEPLSQTMLAENIPPAQRARELGEWLRNFPESLKF